MILKGQLKKKTKKYINHKIKIKRSIAKFGGLFSRFLFISFFIGESMQINFTLKIWRFLVQVAKDLMIDTRDPSSKSSCFIFLAKFISKINKTDSIFPFSLSKKKKQKPTSTSIVEIELTFLVDSFYVIHVQKRIVRNMLF